VTERASVSRREQIERLQRLAEKAVRLFDIEGASLSLLRLSQFFNTSFGVTAADGSRYVLRIHRPSSNPARKRLKIESELWWMNRVREDLHLAVPRPVRTPSGEEVVYVSVPGVPEPRYCVLFHFVAGRFLQRGQQPRHLEQVGMLTARLHEYSTQLTVPPTFMRNVVDRADPDFEDSVAGLVEQTWSVQAADTIRAAIRRAGDVQQRLGNDRDTFGVIHADIHHWNYLFHRGEIRLIDFDDCGWGHYLYDLAVTTQQIARLPQYHQLREALLAGYRRVRPLSSEHESMIESFLLLREIQDMTFDLTQRDDSSRAGLLPRIEWVVAEAQRSLASSR
jgi:Ser/Thr protein kinase RdoA (MazF antagonist)